MPFFTNKTKAGIGAIARANGVYREKQLIRDEDISGKVFHNLTAISKISGGLVPAWLCRCSCGKETTVSVYSLVRNQVKSCGCLKHKTAYNSKDHTGERFGMLVAVERLQRYRGKETF